jgi:hypothetical protein
VLIRHPKQFIEQLILSISFCGKTIFRRPSVDTLLVKTGVWNRILEDVGKHLNEHIFDSWFRPIRFDGLDDDSKTLHLRAGQFTKDWVAQYYTGLIKQCLDAQGKRNYEFRGYRAGRAFA